MASATSVLDTKHTDMIHDAQLDYYGRRLATCSSDGLIKVFQIEQDNKQTFLYDLLGHQGPIFQVGWAHPTHGSLLASCSYDRTVCIWREKERVFQYSDHTSSVNSIAWAPHEYGLMLACASSDGHISVLSCGDDGHWTATKFFAHNIGANAVSWMPSPLCSSAQGESGVQNMRLASGGCDNLVTIWKYISEKKSWEAEEVLEGHSNWVRDVAFAPSLGIKHVILASCSQDCTVMIWQKDPDQSVAQWRRQMLPKFPAPVWSLSWSTTGNILAVAGADTSVSLWKEGLDGQWACVTTVDAAQQNPQN
eukprot:GCRY01002572.1.p1 GENE.GCRY01002572.1~~GCRY01002572.1.p1  ORF type:complete len:354 (+),score=38.76 GCRY01002572.1:142-1062(+)